MDFRILGPLEVTNGGGTVLLPLGGAKQRAVLALLILHRRELVSIDRLVDELWGDRAPPTAAKTLQSYVSRLRKVLGGGVLQTRGHAYFLALDGHDVDAERFERLVSEARAAAADGDLEAASHGLDEALGLWRGAPLADIAYEPAVRTAAARLEEMRLATVEDRVEVELARGHDAEVVPELEALVREHPLRERLRGQHMLALYRCGRQAEALAAYQHTRRALVDELGIDPGPSLHELEHKILAQDPALEGPRRAPPLARRPRRPDAIRRGRLLVGIGCVVLAIALGAALLELGRDSGGSQTAILRTNAVGLIDPSSGKLAGAIPVPGSPARMAADGGIVWVGSDDARTLSAIDPRSRSTRSLVAPGAFPTDLAVDEGALWVLDRQQGSVLRINPSYGLVERRIRLGGGGPFLRDRNVLNPWSIAAGAGAVWVTDGSRRLIQIDPRRGRVERRIDAGDPLDGVTVADGGVWAISGPSSSVLRVDPRRGGVTERITSVSNANYASPYPIQIEGGAGALWVLNANTGTVARIDPRQRGIVTTIRIGVEHVPLRLAVGPRTVWVASADGTITRIDTDTNDAHGVRIAHGLNDVAVAGGMVLATGAVGSGTVVPKGVAAGAAGSVRALPSTFCSPVYHASGTQPRRLIAADLPLQGPFALQGAQMSEAIQVVLRANQFRAGRFPLGLQVCDDQTAREELTGFDKCAANARAYAGDPSVIGVVGPVNSGCASSEIPILNRAPHGPLGMVSPSNTYSGLTRRGPGSLPGEPASLYPTGRRNYIRIVATDAVQGAADGELAHRLGVRRLFVVRDGEPYGNFLATAVRQRASRLGVAIAGHATAALPVATLARRIRRSRADGVFVGAYLTPRAVAVVRTARRAVGPTGAILTPDGFVDDRLVAQAGTAAEGLLVSIAGLPIQALGPAGQRFVRRFSANTGAKPLAYSIYAAQAAQVLLDAIARSDGTRRSVTRELFATKVRGGLLGSFDITPTGDTTAGAVTIYRIHDGRRRLVTVIEPAP